MRAFTWPERLPVLLLIVFAFIISGCARDPKAKEAGYLESGKAFMQRKDYARAVLQFQNAIRLMPRDPDAHYQLGVAFLAAGKISAATDALIKATSLNPQHNEAQVQLAGIMALSGVREAVVEGRKRMEEVLRRAPENADALDVLAISEFRLGNSQDAHEHLQQALDKFPHRLQSSVILAKLRLGQHDFKGAEEVLKKAAAPQSAEATTALGQFYLMTGRWSEAKAQFQSLQKADPKSAVALFGLATAQIRLGEQSQAEQTYRAIAALPEKQYAHLHASYLLAAGHTDAAVQEFEQLAKDNPRDRDSRNRLVATYLFTNRISDADKILATVLKANPQDVDALLQRSQILLRSGKQKEAEINLNQVLHFRPDSAQAHYLLARVHQMRGDLMRQREELATALQQNPGLVAARLALAESQVRNNSGKIALETLNAAPENQKGTMAFILERNLALFASGDPAGARKGIAEGLAMARTPDILVQDAVLKATEKDYAGARASAEEALKESPEDIRALHIVASSYVLQNQPEAALKAVQSHAARYPKSARIQHLLGEWLLARGERKEARTAFENSRGADPHFVAADLALAQMDFEDNRPNESRSTLWHVLASDDANIPALLLLGSVEHSAGNVPAAVAQYRRVLDISPTNVPALNNLAYLLVDSLDQVDEGLKYAQRACELAPDSLDAQGTLGWALYRKGFYESAVQHLQKAVTGDGAGTGTQNAALRKFHLALSYLKKGDRDRSRALIQAVVSMKPGLPSSELAIAAAVLRTLP